VQSRGAAYAPADRQNLKARWQIAKREFAEGKLISEEELFQDLD
jgi:hypothetical protein